MGLITMFASVTHDAACPYQTQPLYSFSLSLVLDHKLRGMYTHYAFDITLLTVH